jgi:HPr kinase/phosphorylase
MTVTMALSRIDLTIHGVLVNVGGTGVLLMGTPGSGKSECALELLSRGHSLIADDVVEIAAIEGSLIGSAPQRFEGLLEIRDLGILDVGQIFGIDAFERCHRIDLLIELMAENQDEVRDRIGTVPVLHEILQVRIPKYVLTRQNRNVPLLVETAARLWKYQITSATDTLTQAHDLLVSSAAAGSTDRKD